MANRRRFASRPEQRIIFKLLEAHLKEVGSTGEFDYAEGWSDAAIAKAASPETGVPVSKISVARTRQQVFGRLHRVTPPAAKAKLRDALAELEQQMGSVTHQFTLLVQDVATLVDRFNTLCETLNLNHVAQVKHLKTEMKTTWIAGARRNATA